MIASVCFYHIFLHAMLGSDTSTNNCFKTVQSNFNELEQIFTI